MHLKIIPLVVLAISLVGITQLGTVNAATHTFELDWGEAGISKPGSFLSPQHLAFDSENNVYVTCLLYTSPSPRDKRQSRMPSSA